MARMAQVMSRQPGQMFVPEMLAALTVGDYAEVPDGQALSEPGWTLFCFDLDQGEAVFVQTGLMDLSAAPFCYQAQYQTAVSVLRMKMDAFLDLGAVLPRRDPAIHLFNIGHCGSTLLHAVLNASGAAFCISEPPFTFQLAMARQDLGAERISALMGAGLGFLRQFAGAGRGPLVVKHFSQATTVMAEFQAAEPQSKSVFMDRSAEEWSASVYGFAQRMGGAVTFTAESRHFIWWIMTGAQSEDAAGGLLDFGEDGSAFEEIAAMAWVLHQRDFGAMRQAGADMIALRYEDLLADRRAELTGLFARLGLPQDGLDKAMLAFDADSHAGTATAREVPVVPLGAEGRARVRAFLAQGALGLAGKDGLGAGRVV